MYRSALLRCGASFELPSSSAAVPIAQHLKKTRKLRPSAQYDPRQRYMEVSVIGLPNVGKSQLANALCGRSVSCVSRKINTTRENVWALFTDQTSMAQVVLRDTPGLVNARLNRHLKTVIDDEPHLVDSQEQAVARSGLLLCVLDAADFAVLHRRILYLLHKYRTMRSALVLNKIDLMKNQDELISITDRLTCGGKLAGGDGGPTSNNTGEISLELEQGANGEVYRQIMTRPIHHVRERDLQRCFADHAGWPHFDRVFYTSALYGQGVGRLKQYLVDCAPVHPWRFGSDEVTNRSDMQLALDAVRAALLDHVDHQIPYQCKLRISHWEYEKQGGLLRACVDVIVKDDFACSLIIGHAGSRIRSIAAAANQRLRNGVLQELYLRVAVKLDKAAAAAQQEKHRRKQL